MPLMFKGYPRCTNADDLADSPVIAAWLSLVNDPQRIDMRKYIVPRGFARFPLGNSVLELSTRCFSRDQLVMLAAGFHAQGIELPWSTSWFAPNDMDEVTGKWKMPDLLSPSVRNHLELCSGRKGSWLGYRFLELDIAFASKVDHEHNQLQAMCIVAGPRYVKKYVRANPKWHEATIKYWNDTTPGAYNRGESELAAQIIKLIERLAAV